jgi:hypothetical protein
MKTIKLPQILFSLAMIAVIVFAALPVSSAHALSNSATTPSLTSAHVDEAGAVVGNIIVCKNVTVWRNGHRITLRVCHRV